MGAQDIRRDIQDEVLAIAQAAKEASSALALMSGEARNDALVTMACALRDRKGEILAANAADVSAARASGVKDSLIDRLMLTRERIDDMAASLESLAALSDPVGVVQEARVLASGIELTRVSVPLGVVAVVYEARPNVTADAAGICLKAGNAVVLRGGSMAASSNAAIASVLREAVCAAGLPARCIGLITTTDRAATDALMQLHGVVDVLVPRGGAGLIRHCIEHSRVPVIETGTGNCHVYVHETADFSMAANIVENAKCRRFGVCNAAETLLVDSSIANDFLPGLFARLARAGVLLHCDEQALACASFAQEHALCDDAPLRAVPAVEADWETEYLAPELAVKCTSGVDDAIAHVNRYTTKHSEAIVANVESSSGFQAAEKFLERIDAAAVYVNASTAFTDGGMFGLGAEIGISTQKLHVRGPFAADALTSYKYVLRGTGQVRA